MFGPNQAFSNLPLDKDYVEARASGSRYTRSHRPRAMAKHTRTVANDELAISRSGMGNLNMSEAKKPEMLQYEYARSALKLGLQLEKQFGTNPYKFGMVGSTTRIRDWQRSRKTTSSAR